MDCLVADAPRNAGLKKLVAAELAAPVDPRVTEMAAAIAAKHGAASRAVLFYGSCLQQSQLDGLMLDFYLIVSDYRAAFDKTWLATANRLIPPNVFPFAHHGLAAKYAVLSEADFAALNGPEASNVSVWARFAQPTRLVWAADAAAKSSAIDAVARAAPTLLSLARPMSDGSDPLDAWRTGFTLTYACELRAERNARPAAIVDADPERYRAFARAFGYADEIDEVLQAAPRPGHSHIVATIGPVSTWLAEQAEQHGVSISGSRHTVDTSAVRHVIKNHGDEAAERRRGQLPITDRDFRAIPQVVTSPDLVAFGAKGRRGEDLIAYVKYLADGSTIYLEEVLVRRKRLALVTMWKVPGTIDANRMAATVNPNVRNDARDALHIIEVPSRIKIDAERWLELRAEAAPALPRKAAERRWKALRRNGKALSVARLAKASFTFAGGIDYLAWKISRHSGAKVVIKPWQRRWPLLGAVVLVPRLLMKGAIR